MLLEMRLKKENRERRNEIQRLERRVLQKEENLERKLEDLEKGKKVYKGS